MEQPPPDLLTSDEAENHLICEKLLGWEKVLVGTDNYPAFKRTPHEDPIYAPSFTTWADAGLILDAMQAIQKDHLYKGEGNREARTRMRDALILLSDEIFFSTLTPETIRAAALKWIRSLP